MINYLIFILHLSNIALCSKIFLIIITAKNNNIMTKNLIICINFKNANFIGKYTIWKNNKYK